MFALERPAPADAVDYAAPRVSLARRLLNSAAFRSGPFARAIILALPGAPRRRSLPPAPFRLLAVCGSAHIALLRESLRSLLASWSALPELLVISDGTMSAAEIGRAIDFWPGPRGVRSREEMVARVRAFGVANLDKLAEVSGFGTKFAAIVASAREMPTLFVDADVLWFRDFAEEASRLATAREPVVLRVAEDYQPAYDAEVLAECGERLDEPPFLNTGVVFLKGDLLACVDLSGGLAAAARRPHPFAEQTLLAVAARRLGAPPLAQRAIACLASDSQSLSITYRGRPWRARHYVGPVRHLFWRDALGLRLGVSV